MLTRSHRLVSSSAFAHTVRRGRRAGTRTLVLHLDGDPDRSTGSAVRVGFVVGRSVGPAVTRNLVKRRLRHVVRDRLASLPTPAVLVVRALPAAADASYASLSADFDAALPRLVGART